MHYSCKGKKGGSTGQNDPVVMVTGHPYKVVSGGIVVMVTGHPYKVVSGGITRHW